MLQERQADGHFSSTLSLSKRHTRQMTSGDERGPPVMLYPICLRLWGGLSADLPL